MRLCFSCKKEQPENCFANNAKRINYECKTCSATRRQELNRSKEGRIKAMYNGQKSSSRRRGHPLPSYTRQELIDWVLTQPEYDDLYDSWVASGYVKSKIPSIDRLEDDKPYSITNIRLTTWEVNQEEAYKGIKNGTIQNHHKVVTQRKLDGTKVATYVSISEAARQTGIHNTSISSCLSGRYKTAGGYLWS